MICSNCTPLELTYAPLYMWFSSDGDYTFKYSTCGRYVNAQLALGAKDQIGGPQMYINRYSR